MAVYTPVSADQCRDFLALYDSEQVGTYQTHKGILRGVENSNFFVETSRGQFVLTLYEKRVAAHDLPFFLGFANHLNQAGLAVPEAVQRSDRSWSGTIGGKPAALITRLAGESLDETQITPVLAAQAGRLIARMHQAAQNFTGKRANTLGFASWHKLLQEAHRLETAHPHKTKATGDKPLARAAQVLEFCTEHLDGMETLPRSVVHADLFCDNFLATGETIRGVIDFYFACEESLAYDLAVAAIAWSSRPQNTQDTGGTQSTESKQSPLQEAALEALLEGYRTHRAQSDTLPPISPAEQAAWRALCAGAGLRFFLTRFIDAHITDTDSQVAVKDPLPMLDLAETFAFDSLPKTALL